MKLSPKTILLWLTVTLLASCGRRAPHYQEVVLNGDKVGIPLAAVNDGGVHFFTYRYGGKNINFFVRTDGKGHLHAHFDACYSCFKYKLGYVRKGRKIVCIACQIGYNLDDEIWDYVGACAPINLKSRIVGDQLVIKQRWLEKGEKFF